jgi:hypothetical protein
MEGRADVDPATVIERENFARYLLFPKEIPPPTRKRMDFVADIIGERAYEQMNEMAKKGDFASAPDRNEMDSGFNRRSTGDETYNIFRGVYNGGILTMKKVQFEASRPARIDMGGMLRGAGVADAAGAVDYLCKRFLRASMQSPDREALTRFLAERLGSKTIDYNRAGLETDLRELLHLVMSLPEYQLA